MSGDLAYLDIHEAAALIRRHELSSTELTHATLDRIDILNPYLLAFITVCRDEALEAAARADRELASGLDRGLLHGIPVSLKDNIATAGIRTTAASRLLHDWIPDRSARVWERLSEAGAVLVGKTNLHEFAMASTLVNQDHGAARNPWDITRTTNGSSSGSGAAVAAGLSYAALGTETGASLLRPASFCGITGIRATYDTVSRSGVIPNSWTLDHIGPLTRSVQDAAIVLGAISENGPAFATRATERNLAGTRIGVPWRHFQDSVEPGVLAAFRASIDVLREAGATIVEIDLPISNYAAAVSTVIMRVDALAWHARGIAVHPEGYSPPLLRNLQNASQIGATDYLVCQQARRAIRREIAAIFETVDVIAGPTTATAATPIAGGFGPMLDRPLEIGPHATNIHRIPSLIGLPAISVPCGFSDDVLPIGLRLIGRPNGEKTVLATAEVFENRTSWKRRPPIDALIGTPHPEPLPYVLPEASANSGAGYTPELASLRAAVDGIRKIADRDIEPALSFIP